MNGGGGDFPPSILGISSPMKMFNHCSNFWLLFQNCFPSGVSIVVGLSKTLFSGVYMKNSHITTQVFHSNNSSIILSFNNMWDRMFL